MNTDEITHEVRAGTTLAGRYRLLEPLGQGGMGAVWKAEHLALKSLVAVKLIHTNAALDETQRTRFMREAQAAAALRSPHVVQIIDYGVDDGIPYIVMELLEGESLAERLSQVGRLGAVETARVLSQVTRAIRRAHDEGIIHRDLKPDNIFLVHNDDDEIAKVLDFGIAKAKNPDLALNASTNTGALVGTPYYMSPEQLQGEKSVDHRTDLWAMGVIAYQCILGKRPFEASNLPDLVLKICSKSPPVPSEHGDVPAGFDQWFARTTAKNPDDRFTSAKELSRELTHLTRGMPSTTDETADPKPEAKNEVITASTLEGTEHARAVTANETEQRRLAGRRILTALVVVLGSAILAWWLWPATPPAQLPEASDDRVGSAPQASAAAVEPVAAPVPTLDTAAAVDPDAAPRSEPSAPPPSRPVARPTRHPAPTQTPIVPAPKASVPAAPTVSAPPKVDLGI